jgi:hypothetical protein
MSRQRQRHLDRQPVEETVRLSIAELVGSAGQVEVEWHSYDWRPDDLMVWTRLKEPISGAVLALLTQRMAEKMRGLLPRGELLGDWLVVVECNGETLARVTWDDLLVGVETCNLGNS